MTTSYRRTAGIIACAVGGAFLAAAGTALAQPIAFNPGPGELLLQRENTPAFNIQVAISVGFAGGEFAGISFEIPPNVQQFRLKRLGLLWTSYSLVFFSSANPPTIQDGFEIHAGRFVPNPGGGPPLQVPGPMLYQSFPVQLADAQPPNQAAFLVTQLVDEGGNFPIINRPASGWITAGLRFDSLNTGGAPNGNTFASSVCYALGGDPNFSPIFAVPGGTTPGGWQAYPQSGRTLIMRLIIEPVQASCGPADIASTAGSPGPDGLVNNGDFQLFIGSFFTANCTGQIPCNPADIGQTDSSPGADGLVNNGDFQLFIASFFTSPCS
jgi:hypothetical protein